MKWSMALGDTTLNTPVVTLNSPFSEMPKISTMVIESKVPHCVANEEEKHLRKTKRKVKFSMRMRNAIHKRGSSAADSDDDSSTKKRMKIRSSKRPAGVIADQKELISLQIQRAMIADEDGDRPIHIAVAQEDIALVKKLCYLMKSVNASLDIINHLRQTPLHVAVIVGNSEAVEVLVRNGASLTCEDRRGNNAIQLSVKYFKEETFSVLLKRQPPCSTLNSFDYEGLTALHYAAKSRNVVAVEGLIKAGADVNSADGKSGRTCLAHAVVAGDVEMVTLLLGWKACVDKTDYSGQNVLDLAQHIGNRIMIEILEKESCGKQLNNFEVCDDQKTSTKPTNAVAVPVKKRKKKKITTTCS